MESTPNYHDRPSTTFALELEASIQEIVAEVDLSNPADYEVMTYKFALLIMDCVNATLERSIVKLMQQPGPKN